MDTRRRGVAVKVFGEYACFSRPEFKVERVSYPVMTPSAARGVLEAIFWKPEFRYEIREIHVVKPGSQTTVLRNEISDPQGTSPVVVEQKRQQRTTLILTDVAYVIRAEISVRRHARDGIGKYLDQFNRRVERGQCHHMPCLGTREFAAFFESPEPEDRCDECSGRLPPDLGQMLFEVAYIEARDRREIEFWKTCIDGRRKVWGYALPLFFHAKLEGGVLRVPEEEYARLYRVENGHA